MSAGTWVKIFQQINYTNVLTSKCMLEEFSLILKRLFDCMNHRILLAKLHLYGIRGVPEDWFSPCLTSRRQKVEVKSPNSTQIFFSDWGTLWHGVHQVSIIGPLFIIHINDLPLRINSISEPILFIEDTGVIISSRNF
jgi:hypothetical protein